MPEDKTITLNIFAGLEDYLDTKQRKGNKIKINSDIKTVIDLIEKLELPKEKVAMIMINGDSAKFNDTIKEDDVISLFPPIGGG